eukprot:2026478-Pleurochrysis_carterae.AAC.4
MPHIHISFSRILVFFSFLPANPFSVVQPATGTFHRTALRAFLLSRTLWRRNARARLCPRFHCLPLKTVCLPPGYYMHALFAMAATAKTPAFVLTCADLPRNARRSSCRFRASARAPPSSPPPPPSRFCCGRSSRAAAGASTLSRTSSSSSRC